MYYPEPDYEPPLPEEDESEERYYYREVFVRGKLSPPFPPLQRDISAITEPLAVIAEALRESNEDLAAIFDGLDRLMAPEKFWAVVQQDFRALRNLRVSVLSAAPLSVLYGKGRQIGDYFDQVWHLPTAVADPQRSPFLMQVLEKRGAKDLLDQRRHEWSPD